MTVMVTTVSGEQVALQYDFGMQAQHAAETHIGLCWAHLRADEEGEAEGDSPSVGPFCGCTTCEVREILHASLPFLQAGFARDGQAPMDPYVINLIQCPIQEPTDG